MIIICLIAPSSTIVATPLQSNLVGNGALSTPSKSSRGNLYVIVGPMACGKTEELMRIVRILRLNFKVLVCKHSLDTRSENLLKSRGRPDEIIEAYPISDPQQILDLYKNEPFDYLAFDEIQFASPEMISVIQQLLANGIHVIVSGLDMDFKREPFGYCMPYLLSTAYNITKLKAVCTVCGSWDASYTQRLIDGQPARKDDPLILIDDGKTHNVVYEPRCRACHVLPD